GIPVMLRWFAPLSLVAVLSTACAAATPPSQPTPPPGPTPQSGPTPQAGPTAQPGGAPKRWTSAPAMSIDPNKQYTATLKTAQGDVVMDLLPKDAPIAVNNFVFLARQGYY